MNRFTKLVRDTVLRGKPHVAGPVDRRVLTDGSPVTPDHREIDSRTGMQKAYVVLSEEERAKGYVRPIRRTYTHLGAFTDELAARTYPAETVVTRRRTGGCGKDTTMDPAIAETYARDPGFYSGTFCVACRAHFPLDQFVWKDDPDQQVGS